MNENKSTPIQSSFSHPSILQTGISTTSLSFLPVLGLIVLAQIFGLENVMAAANNLQRLNQNGVALCADRDSKKDDACYDPVSYFTDGKAGAAGAEGSAKYRFKFKDATFVFVSEAHMKLFQENPQKYLPEFGGWCAYAVAAKKDKVDIDPRSFSIQDGRLLLFYDGVFAHTRQTWLTDKDKSPQAYLKEADLNWPKVQDKEP